METQMDSNGNLVIRIPVNSPPKPSNSKKTLILASSHGNQKVEIEGVTYWLGVNCYTYPDMLTKAQPEKLSKELTAEQKKEIEEHNKEVTKKISR